MHRYNKELWELCASQSENIRVFVTPFTLSSTHYLYLAVVKTQLDTRLIYYLPKCYSFNLINKLEPVATLLKIFMGLTWVHFQTFWLLSIYLIILGDLNKNSISVVVKQSQGVPGQYYFLANEVSHYQGNRTIRVIALSGESH